MKKLLLFLGIGILCVGATALLVPSQLKEAAAILAVISLVMGLICLFVSFCMKCAEPYKRDKLGWQRPTNMDERDYDALRRRQVHSKQTEQRKVQWIMLALAGYAFMGLGLVALSSAQTRGGGGACVCIGLVILFFAYRMRAAVKHQEEIEEKSRQYQRRELASLWDKLMSRKPSVPTDVIVTEMTVQEYCRFMKRRSDFDRYYTLVDDVLLPVDSLTRRSEYITGDPETNINNVNELIQFHDEVQLKHRFVPIRGAQCKQWQVAEGETQYTLQVTLNQSSYEREYEHISGMSMTRTGRDEVMYSYAVPDNSRIRVTEEHYRLTPPRP